MVTNILLGDCLFMHTLHLFMQIKKDSKLYRVIQSFRKDFKFLKDNPILLQSFYEYVFHKYNIRNEEGMIQVERVLFEGVFES